MYKINLHAHSNYSDGNYCMYSMAKQCEELGFSACVITDHDYMFKGGLRQVIKQREEAKMLNENSDLKIPIIIGCEINILGEEGLLFGEEAINRWFMHSGFDLKQGILFGFVPPTVKDRYFFKGTEHALIVAHPGFSDANVYEEILQGNDGVKYEWVFVEDRFIKSDRIQQLMDMSHGFEIINRGVQLHEQPSVDIIQKYYPCRMYSNSDAHSKGLLERAWNNTEKHIDNEKDLITWIQSGKGINSKDSYESECYTIQK